MNDIDINELEESRTNLTVLYFNTSAMCCAPVAPMSLYEIFNNVSVCIERYRCESEREQFD
jgi:hypothetical protein